MSGGGVLPGRVDNRARAPAVATPGVAAAASPPSAAAFSDGSAGSEAALYAEATTSAAAEAAAAAAVAARGVGGGRVATGAGTKLFTLAIVRRRDGVLVLGRKKRGFGTGRLMGFGGKVEAGESIESAARRELQEECCITATQMEKRAEITFHFEHDPKPWLVHVFRVDGYEGEPTETEEMRPEFHSCADIPFGDMFPDDVIWLPPFLQGKAVRGEFWVSKDGMHMSDHRVETDVTFS